MELRKAIKLGSTLGITLPKRYSKALDIRWRDYLEVFLVDSETIGIRQHKVTFEVKNVKGEITDTLKAPFRNPNV